jgi:hypothetical protein
MSSENSLFIGIPCYSHQPDQNTYIRLNEEVYLASQSEGRNGFLYWPKMARSTLTRNDTETREVVLDDILVSYERKTEFKYLVNRKPG